MSSRYFHTIIRPISLAIATIRTPPKQPTNYLNTMPFSTPDGNTNNSTQSEKNDQDHSPRSIRLQYAVIPYIVNVILAIGLTVLAGFTFRPFPPLGPKMLTLNCGSTPTEARNNNCTYDVLGNIWVPTPCLDSENLADFKRLAPWQAYDSANATRQLTEEEMSNYLLPDGYWTPVREHMIHCALMWRRLHRGFERDARLLDKHVLNFHHTEHCSKTLMEHLDMPTSFLDEIRTRTEAGYSSCQVPA
ncbi:hypothetical protein NX059_006013 [Plenodomus lindquistii]|nr:hypothetical protein NX059_006013 [Plenodomus lindquistii]